MRWARLALRQNQVWKRHCKDSAASLECPYARVVGNFSVPQHISAMGIWKAEGIPLGAARSWSGPTMVPKAGKRRTPGQSSLIWRCSKETIVAFLGRRRSRCQSQEDVAMISRQFDADRSAPEGLLRGHGR